MFIFGVEESDWLLCIINLESCNLVIITYWFQEFFVSSFRLSTQMIVSSANKESLISSFPTLIHSSLSKQLLCCIWCFFSMEDSYLLCLTHSPFRSPWPFCVCPQNSILFPKVTLLTLKLPIITILIPILGYRYPQNRTVAIFSVSPIPQRSALDIIPMKYLIENKCPHHLLKKLLGKQD